MSKSVNLLDIRFFDKNGIQMIREEYNITFGSHEAAELFIEDKKKYWVNILKTDLVITPRQNETIEEIEIQKIFKLTAKNMGIHPKYIFKRTRSANIVEARRIAIAICSEFGLSISIIGKAVGLNHTTILFHKNKFYDLCNVEPGYEDRYDVIKDNVLKELNGEFLEDGSGKLK